MTNNVLCVCAPAPVPVPVSLEIEPRALCLLGKCSITDLLPRNQ